MSSLNRDTRTATPSPDSDGPDAAARLRADRLAFVVKQANRAPVFALVTSLYIVYLMWDYQSHWKLLAWSSATVGLLLARSVACRLFLRLDTPDAVRTWIGVMLAFAFLNGVVGGSAGFLFFDDVPDNQRAQLTMILGCWSAAAVSTAGYLPGVFYAFQVPFLAPVTLSWFLSGTDEGVPLGLLLVLFGVLEMLFARDNGRMAVESLRIKYDNIWLIGQLRRRQAEATQAQQEAEAANSAKSMFLAAASHDLRQPLQALSLFNEVLEAEAAKNARAVPRLTDLAQKFERSLSALRDMFEKLLDVSKLDAGQVPLSIGPCTLQQLLDQVETTLGPSARAKRLEFIVHPSAERIESDPHQLARIVCNLAENAIRYTARGSVALRVIPRRRHVVIEVRDTGSGIAPAERHRVFREFYQSRRSEAEQQQGWGLGLHIATLLTAILHCRISLHSAVGEGSVFRVFVPRTWRDPMAQSPKDVQASAPPIAAEQLRGMAVAIVDDDESVRTALCALLGSWQCRTFDGPDPETALAALERAGTGADAILCDYRLGPDLTGPDALAAMLQRHPGAVALILTGDTSHERLQDVRASGYAVLHKPVTGRALREALSVALSRAPPRLDTAA